MAAEDLELLLQIGMHKTGHARCQTHSLLTDGGRSRFTFDVVALVARGYADPCDSVSVRVCATNLVVPGILPTVAEFPLSGSPTAARCQ